jgi:hypothetical protein
MTKILAGKFFRVESDGRILCLYFTIPFSNNVSAVANNVSHASVLHHMADRERTNADEKLVFGNEPNLGS